ncbi:hypothetical protein FOA52_008323 [Chlamydomonas sp. UWO 241]|nr:hypothetical protein FOA52_008323 [Chlamydomonas sp. UWO 241]
MAGTVGEVSGPRFLHSSLRKDSFDTSPLMVSPLKGDRPDDKGSPAGGLGSPNWKLLVGMAAVSVIISYADRSNISTAILPMATDFGWDKAFQGVVLSSFFAGYALTQMLGGQLADRYGGKIVLTAGISIWSICTGLIPMAAAAGTVPLLGMRVLLGLGEGVAFPAIHSLIARNVPYASRGTAVGLVTAASYGGTALAFGVSPWLIANWGWPVAGMIGPGVCLLAAVSPLVGESASAASTLITVGLGFSALSLAGVSTNHLDIAPKHAGLIFGAGNTAATLAGFLSVPITGYILQVWTGVD